MTVLPSDDLSAWTPRRLKRKGLVGILVCATTLFLCFTSTVNAFSKSERFKLFQDEECVGRTEAQFADEVCGELMASAFDTNMEAWADLVMVIGGRTNKKDLHPDHVKNKN